MDITHSPYKGLMPYTEKDAEFFFGRDRDCAIITANLFAARLTILFGASGVGKSSVLQAGVAHNLRQKEGVAVIVFNDWHESPLDNLIQAVRQEMERVLGTSLDQAETVPFKDFLADCASRMDGQLVIILDQFEEYLLYHPGDEGPGSFLTEFVRVVNNQDVPVSFLIAIREDSLAKLDRFKGRIPQLFGNYLRLDHLDEVAAREAIEKPLDKVGWEWEGELVEAVIDQVRVGRIGLGEVGRGEIRTEPTEAEARVRIETSFLQIVMTRLWNEEQAHDSRKIHKRTLDDLGGAKQIVRDYLDAFMDGLPHKHQAVSAAIFHYLVTPSGTKIAQSAGDLAVYADHKREQIAQVLSTLAGPARLLRTVAAARAGGEPRYEIYHDSLAPAVLYWRGRYYQEQREIRTRRWAIRLGILFVALAGLAIVLAVMLRGVDRSAAQATALAADSIVTVAKATAQAGAETATAALDAKNQATTDFRAWQTAQAQATAASQNLLTVRARVTATSTPLVAATPQPGVTETPSLDPTVVAAAEMATAAAQSLQIAEQKAVAAAAELKATATAAASATAVARGLREGLQAAGLTGRGVQVAILSTGIDATHPDLAGRIAASVDLVGEGIEDGNGFGTFLTGIVGGSGTASGGLYKGWAPEADLYIAKVTGEGGAGTLSEVIAGIEWAIAQKVDIVVVDVGGAPGCDGSDELSQKADAAVQAGLVVVVPAGNSGPEPGTVGVPGCARLPITVGAAELNTVANFSSRGPTLDGRTKPDLLFSGYGVGAQATGAEIGSVVAPGYVEATSSGVAAAHAAGAIALLLQANPDLTPAEVKDVLMTTATDLGLEANAQGAGLANIEKALAHVKDGDGDGIPDAEDACPDEPGSPLAGGCPEPTPTITLTFTPSATPTEMPTPTPIATPQLPTATPTPLPLPMLSPSRGSIAYVSWWDDNNEIAIIKGDGSQKRRLTFNSVDDWDPALSPDGQVIAFMSSRDDDQEVYRMNSDGSDQTRLTHSSGIDRWIAFSPDSYQIIFTSYRDGNGEVYIMNKDGSEQRNLTRHPADDRDPAFSPDGRQIVFVSNRDGNDELYVMDADGNNVNRLTNSPGANWEPSFSPDGTRVIFVYNQGDDQEIYVMGRQDGKGVNLTNNPAKDRDPAFSPDGKEIVFTSDREGVSRLFVMNNDGSNVRRLTDGQTDWSPSWSR